MIVHRNRFLIENIVMTETTTTNSSNAQPNQTTRVLVTPTKSAGVAAVLTILFGPIGMFYSTIMGGVVMLLVSLIIGVLTLGFGLLITWPICVAWGVIAVNNYNKDLISASV